MAARKLTTDEKLDALRQLIDNTQQQGSDNTALKTAFEKALNDKSNFLVAKAADWIADSLLYELIPRLCAAYERFMQKPLERDKTCAAKRAIARALYTLDYDDTEFYRRNLRYRQLEPVWGGSVDTAVELRCTCALGLVASGDSRVLLNVIELLHDDEYQVRIGAIKAISLAQPFHAELILRNKILQGDAEPDVISECFLALVQVVEEDCLEFLASYLDFTTPSTSEGAALALGESRLEAALPLLVEASERLSPQDDFQAVFYRAIALHRNANAFNYLLNQMKLHDAVSACHIINALSIFNYNDELRKSIESIVKQKASKKISDCFKKYWCPE